MSKWAYIIIKVEHDAPNTEVVARECDWDIEHDTIIDAKIVGYVEHCLLYTSPSPRDVEESRMPSSA